MKAPTRPAASTPLLGKSCTHWDGDQARECGSQVGVRPFLQGPRCPIHDPNVMKGEKR